MKRFLITYISAFGFLSICNAQIGGISGSKLSSYCVDVVDHKKLEFEPGIYHFSSSSEWNNEGGLSNYFQTPDSLINGDGMYIRMTYGLFNKLEFGATIDSDLRSSNWGLRYVIFQKDKVGLASIAGINFPIANTFHNKNINLSEANYSFGGGMVSTINFSNKLSVDLTYQYLAPFRPLSWNNGTSQMANVDFGYYLENRHFQLISGIGYSRFVVNNGISDLLTFCYGFTIETDNFIIVACFPNDLYGKNSPKNNGLVLAVTLTI